MKRVLSFILVIVFLTANIVTAAHAGCEDGNLCAETQAAAQLTADKGDQNDSSSGCDCYFCGHHHVQVSLLAKEAHSVFGNQNYHPWDQSASLLNPHSPPVKPPKA